jgi:hypothetical protein
MKLGEYKSWAERDVRQDQPGQYMRKQAITWNKLLTSMALEGVYERVVVILLKCEFLGGVYVGTTEDSGVASFRAYLDQFFPPAYVAVHNLSGLCPPNGSEFFSILRNRAAHGFTPSAVALPLVPGQGETDREVVGWWIPSQPHLGRNDQNGLRIDVNELQKDFVDSCNRYADYLDADTDIVGPDNARPHERFRRGFWSRFRPLHVSSADWQAEGRTRGLFN